jgi:recombinational DNA repair protein (RecF pathway)
MKKKFTRTNLIVLRKTQYLESSLVIAGLPSPELGRIDVIVKGAKKFTKKPFLV